MPKITGDRRHSKRLKSLSGSLARLELGKAIYAASDYLRVEARRSIAEGAIQGAGHIPSLPGEPPNWDTGLLANGIINYKTGELSAETASTAPYSMPLEVGSSKMSERPFMRPAANKTRPIAEKLVRAALVRVMKATS